MGVFDKLMNVMTDSSDAVDSSDLSSTDIRLIQIDTADSVNPNEPTDVPGGVDFRFHIKGQLTESDEAKFNGYVSKSTLRIYFDNIRVQYETVGERYPNPPETAAYGTDVRIDKLPHDESLVRIHASECLRVVPEGKVDEFYDEVRESYSAPFVDIFGEMGYNAQIIEMLIVHRFL